MRKSEAERRGDALTQARTLGRCNVPNAAVLMGIHHHTLRQYIDKGFIIAVLEGKRPWITVEEMERYKRFGKRDPDDISD